jgi:hypothetical protein
VTTTTPAAAAAASRLDAAWHLLARIMTAAATITGAAFAGLLAVAAVRFLFPAIPPLPVWCFGAAVTVTETHLLITFLTRTRRRAPAPREVMAAYLASLRCQVETGTASAVALVIDEAAQLLGVEDQLARAMREDLRRIMMLGRSQGVTVAITDPKASTAGGQP